MTRICIVGNSHVAALKQGWDAIKADHPDVSVTFFGVPGKSLNDVDLGDGTLSPRTSRNKQFFSTLSGGSDTIHVKDFDRFVVVGLELSIFRWLNMYKQTRHAPFNLTFGTPQVFDAETFDLCRQNVFAGTSGDVIYHGLKSIGAQQVHVCPQPLPAETILENERFWKSLLDAEDPELIASAYREDMARGFPDAASIIWQPDETRVGPLFTSQTLSHGSRRLNMEKSHGETDNQHMNAEYGATILRKIVTSAA